MAENKKYGVYANGKLRYSNNDYDLVSDAAKRIMRAEKCHTWVCKVGSFVNV